MDNIKIVPYKTGAVIEVRASLDASLMKTYPSFQSAGSEAVNLGLISVEQALLLRAKGPEGLIGFKDAVDFDGLKEAGFTVCSSSF